METTKGKAKWRTFYLTLALAIGVCIAVYLLAFNGAITVEWMSVAMMAAICMLPARSLTSAVLNWACEVSMSISEPIQKWLRPILVIKNLDPEKNGSHLNHEVIALAEKMIWVIFLLISLAFLTFQRIARSRAQVLVTTIRGVWRGLQNSPGAILVYLILKLLFLGFLVVSVRAIYRDWAETKKGNVPSFSWTRRMLYVAILWAVQKFVGFFTLGFAFTLIAQDIAFWLAIGLAMVTVHAVTAVINNHSHSHSSN